MRIINKKALQEIWKDVKGFEGLYQVSNTGKVKSVKHKDRGYEHYIIPYNNQGYSMIGLRKNGKLKSTSIHRLVALNFIENINNLPEVNHVDCNKSNNNVNNLQWISRKENQRHAIKNGLVPVKRGEEQYCHKLTDEKVREIRNNENLTHRELAKIYNVSKSTITRVKSRRWWKHVE